MKKAAFKGAGGKLQFKHKFGDLNDEKPDDQAHDHGTETDVLSAEELTGSSVRGADGDTDSDFGAASESGHHGHHKGGHHKGGRSSDGGDKFQLSGSDKDDEDGDVDGVETDVSDLVGDGGADLAVTSPDAGDGHTVTATYSDAAVGELLFMIEEEKLAGDIYEVFYGMYGLKIFDNIAQSEDRHFDAVVNQAETMGIDVDQFLFEPAGTFQNEDLQELYDTLLAQGSESVTAALEVGKAIEEKDITDIADAIDDVEGTALASVYESLLAGSGNHLEAFDSLLMA